MLDILKLKETIGQGLSKKIELSEDGQVISVLKEAIVGLLKALKEKFGFIMLADITAAEYDDKLEIVYHVMAMDGAQILKIKVNTSKDSPSVPSITPVWKAASVLEREVYDLMGVNFEGHPELKRILCPEDFEGHPLRKNFTLNITERFI